MYNDLVVFELDDTPYALPAQQVREVCRFKDFPIYPMPKAPAFCLGLIHLRGEMLPVITIEPFLKARKSSLGDLVIVNSHFGTIAIPIQRMLCHHSFEPVNLEQQTEFITVLTLDHLLKEVVKWRN